MVLKILNLYAGIGGNRKLWTGDIEITAVARGQNEAVYPDMQLYQEIIFLMYNFEGKWVVENVISYYEPLIKPQELAAHYFWSNFNLQSKKVLTREHNSTIDVKQKLKGFNLDNYKNIDKQKILRNCVEPETGLHIFECAFRVKQTTLGDL